MDTRIPPIRSDVVAVTTAPRPTAAPVRVSFSEVLANGARGIVSGAEAAMKSLPGAPLMAVAIRGGSPPSGAFAPRIGLDAAGGAGGVSGAGGGTSGAGAAGSPEGPGGGASTSGSGADASVEGSLAQSQEMNLYYLQIQERVNAENRSFSTLSNVLKAEHDTVKTAIGNIR